MMHEVEVHLIVKDSGLVIGRFHPKPIMEANPFFLIGTRLPIIEAAFRHHPNELETVIGVGSQKTVDTIFVLGVSDHPDLMGPGHLPSPVPSESGL
jgi:hypothetical protein